MRGSVVFRVYGMHHDRLEGMHFGTFRTRGEAEAEIAKLNAREMNGENWASQYHDRGFEIREAVVEVDFEVPTLPKPRDSWVLRTTPISHALGWASTRVEVCRRGKQGLENTATYTRNYPLHTTFEPFRQGEREYALISRDYQATAVLDLATGKVIAEEPEERAGFCPIGFYVPDWWDIHDGSIIPGSDSWDADREWPRGDFGFVWGCLWGDDSSWKVQHLDLSRVSEGILTRSDLYGYLELAPFEWNPPWLDLDRPSTLRSRPPSFLRVSLSSGVPRVSISAALRFEIQSGALDPWQQKCLNREESGPE